MASGLVLWFHVNVPGAPGIRAIARATALWACLFFCITFTASSTYQIWPCRWTRWQIANRRYLGLSFAILQTAHLFSVGYLWFRYPLESVPAMPSLSYGLAGSLVCVVMYLMVATSFARTARWIGRVRWDRLHLYGSYSLWITFALAFQVYLSHHPEAGPLGVAPVVLLFCALALRVTAQIKRQRQLRLSFDITNAP
jgi:methionine sulfoxide reductase heme-binding subunit